MIPSAYCQVDDRFITTMNGVVKSLKQHTITD